MGREITVACLSIRPVPWKKEQNFQKAAEFLRDAAGQGADVALTPAGCLEGISAREAAAKNRGLDFLELAEPPDGPYLTEFRNLARQLWMHIVVGFALREGPAAYPGAVFIERTGTIAGQQVQTHFSREDRTDWFFHRPGQSIRAFDTDFGRVGLLVGADRWQPAVAECLRLDGAQILFNPAAGIWTQQNDEAVMRRSFETGLPVVHANPRTSLVVSRGERIAKQIGTDRITLVRVVVPEAPSTKAARALEREILAQRDRGS